MQSTVYHEENENFRVVIRGRNWYVQERLYPDKGTKTQDPWADIDRSSMNSQAEAIGYMYGLCPKKPAA